MTKMNNVNQTNSTWTGMVPVDDTALAVTDTGGPGIPVVYLNGSYADQSHWRKVIADLGPGWRHITYDERARGRSKKSADYSFEACVRDVDAVLAARGVKRALLVGWSYGAFLGVHWAARNPERTLGVVGVDSPFPWGWTDEACRAVFADVTVKTVRHYHRLGLVNEPHRDRSGYRRYGSSELLRLIQVRTLAEAGVPLAEIGALLGADPQRFAADLADVKQRLTDRIQELIARRDMLDRLATGNRLLLPDRACALLDRAAEIGFPADFLATCREGLILAKALVPDFDDFLTQIEHSFDDARYMALLKRSWEASAWKPHDPRVEELATAITDHLLANPKLLAISTSLQRNTDAATRYGLINDYQAEVAPTGARLSALIEANLRSAGINTPHQTPTD